MSFRDLVDGGADCGPSNSLSQFAKNFDQDRSLQRDSFLPDDPLAHAGPSQRPGRAGDFDNQFAEEFFAQQRMQNGGGAGPEAFQFHDMRGELSNLIPRGGPEGEEWANDFEKFQHTQPHPAEFDAAYHEAFHAPAPQDWAHEFHQHQMPGQARITEIDSEFEQAFAQHSQAHLEDEWSNQFAEAQRSLSDKGKGKALSSDELTAMFEQYQAGGDGVESADFFEKFNETWKNMNRDGEEAPASWDGEYDDFLKEVNNQSSSFDPDPVTAPLAPYTFETENHFLDHPDPMSEGIRLMENGGSLSEAALALEAAVQREPNNSEAWARLGIVQAENEKEEPAIAALQRAVQEDPNNLSALMGLAVSYTNEAQDLQAYTTLERWIASAYPDIAANAPPQTAPPGMTSAQDLHKRVTAQFLEAARRGRPGSGDLDADVQVGLGVLFYNSGDYDKAVDCFTAGLSARPKDYLLWNRLGATLANSGRSEDAIEAYYKALEIKPSFVRGRYNLGVSCINIGVYHEAAEHLLGALSMHVVGSGQGTNVSNNLWETLRRTFILMERRDLADKATNAQDIGVFRGEFEF
ncbi:hypothetical protein SmJEL517_g02920 [Synchytrium microbalum]|uniref:Uncharacterized protein n=1 Tax=Synchytrium microbalum TaxID=1806994 RepID=A0A507C957_9FUNG|nr:uncharacterized protein SmJEL517_g02920 [Synchytrium microbalum]TPX34526.1 hypothetical protein SmJEL517_g02920 [Synchytrium microbalum]